MQLLRRDLQPAQKTLMEWMGNPHPVLLRELQPPKTTLEGMRRNLQPQGVFMDCRHRDRQRGSNRQPLLRRELQRPRTTLEGMRRAVQPQKLLEEVGGRGMKELQFQSWARRWRIGGIITFDLQAIPMVGETTS